MTLPPGAPPPPGSAELEGPGPWGHPGQWGPPLPGDEQLVASMPPATRPTLPIVPTDYLRFFRSPRFAWWKPLLAVVGAAVLWLAVTMVLTFAGIFLDGFENVYPEPGSFVMRPWTFLMNNLSLAACIPIAWLFALAVFGQRPGWLASVAGRFRWGWFARVLVIALPIWAVLIGVSFALSPSELGWRDTTAFMIAAIVLTTPLQAAGEEYLVRGLLARSVGSWFADERLALGVAALVGATVFMLLHGAGDPWLNVYYFIFGAVSAWLVWRTGGLEASVAIHIVNNMVAMVPLPFGDLASAFDRTAGAGSPFLLVNAAVLVGAALLFDLLARRAALENRTAPGRLELERAPSLLTRGFFAA